MPEPTSPEHQGSHRAKSLVITKQVASGKWQVACGEGWNVYCNLWMARWVYMYKYMCMSPFVDTEYHELAAYSGWFGPSGLVHSRPGQISPGPNQLGIGLIIVENFWWLDLDYTGWFQSGLAHWWTGGIIGRVVGWMDWFSLTAVIEAGFWCALTAASMSCMTSLMYTVLGYFISSLDFAWWFNCNRQHHI